MTPETTIAIVRALSEHRRRRDPHAEEKHLACLRRGTDLTQAAPQEDAAAAAAELQDLARHRPADSATDRRLRFRIEP